MPQFEHDHERTLLQRERESHQDVVEEKDGRRIVVLDADALRALAT